MTLQITNSHLKHPSEYSLKEQEILSSVIKLFSRSGTHGMSMRQLAKELGTAPSVLYHYFENQEELLHNMYRYASFVTGAERAKLPLQKSAHDQFMQLVQFQFDMAENIVAVLKFYLVFRESFAQSSHKTLPKEATQHLEEVLQMGIESGEYRKNCLKDAKIIAHSINGYLLEHFPYDLEKKEQDALVAEMVNFFETSLTVSSNKRKEV